MSTDRGISRAILVESRMAFSSECILGADHVQLFLIFTRGGMIIYEDFR
jgi:hypothetical protein